MSQIEARQIAFLSLCVSMVVVGTLGLAGWVSAGAGLFAAVLTAVMAVSFSAGIFYRARLT